MISVVMLQYNFNEDLALLTKTAIESVNYSCPERELIIVDNASVYGGAFARNEADVYIRNKINLGYPAGVNQGVALSKGEFIAIANNDIKVSPNWWKVAQEILKDPEVGIVHFRMDGYDEERPLGLDTWIEGRERWCSSSFFVIRREAFQGYDEAYGAGGFDDYDHHTRMRAKGWKQAYTNKASFNHMDSITYRTMEATEERAKRDLKNKEYFKTKFGEYPDVMFAKDYPDQVSKPYMPFP